jgi:hypothetical protein
MLKIRRCKYDDDNYILHFKFIINSDYRKDIITPREKKYHITGKIVHKTKISDDKYFLMTALPLISLIFRSEKSVKNFSAPFYHSAGKHDRCFYFQPSLLNYEIDGTV